MSDLGVVDASRPFIYGTRLPTPIHISAITLGLQAKEVDHDTKIAKVFQVDANWITSPRCIVTLSLPISLLSLLKGFY